MWPKRRRGFLSQICPCPRSPAACGFPHSGTVERIPCWEKTTGSHQVLSQRNGHPDIWPLSGEKAISGMWFERATGFRPLYTRDMHLWIVWTAALDCMPSADSLKGWDHWGIDWKRCCRWRTAKICSVPHPTAPRTWSRWWRSCQLGGFPGLASWCHAALQQFRPSQPFYPAWSPRCTLPWPWPYLWFAPESLYCPLWPGEKRRLIWSWSQRSIQFQYCAPSCWCTAARIQPQPANSWWKLCSRSFSGADPGFYLPWLISGRKSEFLQAACCACSRSLWRFPGESQFPLSTQVECKELAQPVRWADWAPPCDFRPCS